MGNNKLFVKLNIQRFATHLVSWDSYYLFSGGSSATVDGDAKGEIRVYLESQNTANNTSYIRLDHYIYTKNMQYGWSAIASATSKYRVTGPNGSTSYQTKSKSNIGYPTDGYILLGSTYHTISHDVSGGGTFTVNGTINVVWGTGTSRTRTTDFYVTIPTIPRYANITSFSIWQTGLNSIAGSVRADRAVDQIQYSLNGGSWTNCNQDFSITGLSPNTQYNVRTRVKSTASQLWTTSGYAYATTSNIATLTSVPNNIDIEKPFTITISRNGASDVSIGIFDTAGAVAFAPYRLVSGSSYTFELTESEKTALFNDMSTVNGKTYRVYLNTNSNAYRTSSDRTFNVVNANPTFSNFEYEDTNNVMVDLTGDDQTIIKGYSNLRARVSTANKMIANKGAVAKEYQLVVGAKQIKANYIDDADVDLTLNAIDNNVFILYAIDTRGNSTPIQKSPANYIDYVKPIIIEPDYEREEDIGTKTTLKFNGSFFNASFGSQTNTISATYKYKRTNSDIWIDGDTPLVLTPDGNNYSCNQLIAGDLGANGFDAGNSYDIEIIVTDKLETIISKIVIDSGKPNMAFAKDGVAINQLYDESQGSGFQISGNKIVFNGLTLFEWVDE